MFIQAKFVTISIISKYVLLTKTLLKHLLEVTMLIKTILSNSV